MCFLLSQYNFCGGVKEVSPNAKTDIKCLFLLFKGSTEVCWSASCCSVCLCVCFSEQCLETMWVVEGIYNAAL